MHPIVEKYGKQLIKELLDIIFITKKIESEVAYNLLLKHKIITRRTKTVYGYIYKGYNNNRIYFTNSRGKYILDVRILDEDMPKVLEDLCLE